MLWTGLLRVKLMILVGRVVVVDGNATGHSPLAANVPLQNSTAWAMPKSDP